MLVARDDRARPAGEERRPAHTTTGVASASASQVRAVADSCAANRRGRASRPSTGRAAHGEHGGDREPQGHVRSSGLSSSAAAGARLERHAAVAQLPAPRARSRGAWADVSRCAAPARSGSEPPCRSRAVARASWRTSGCIGTCRAWPHRRPVRCGRRGRGPGPQVAVAWAGSAGAGGPAQRARPRTGSGPESATQLVPHRGLQNQYSRPPWAARPPLALPGVTASAHRIGQLSRRWASRSNLGVCAATRIQCCRPWHDLRARLARAAPAMTARPLGDQYGSRTRARRAPPPPGRSPTGQPANQRVRRTACAMVEPHHRRGGALVRRRLRARRRRRLAMDHRVRPRAGLTSGAIGVPFAVVVSEGAAANRDPAGSRRSPRGLSAPGYSGKSGAMTTDGRGSPRSWRPPAGRLGREVCGGE